MSPFFIQIIRSVVPIIVGWIVGLLASVSIEVPPETAAGLIVSVSTLAASLYYIAVAWLERTYPAFGWLLGVARNPVYAGKHEFVVTAPENATVTVDLVGTPLTAEEQADLDSFEANGGTIPSVYDSGEDYGGARY